jgi:hypothetical protein
MTILFILYLFINSLTTYDCPCYNSLPIFARQVSIRGFSSITFFCIFIFFIACQEGTTTHSQSLTINITPSLNLGFLLIHELEKESLKLIKHKQLFFRSKSWTQIPLSVIKLTKILDSHQ